MRYFLLPFACLLSAGIASAEAPVVSPEAIVETLSGGPPLTRSLAAPHRGAVPIDRHHADRLRAIDASGVEGLTPEALAASRQLLSELRLSAIDLPIEFEFGSSTLSARAYLQLNALGTALTAERLSDASFILAGHTDAAGGEGVNLGLSKRRADAVRDYLETTHRIQRSRLLSLGFGKSMPKLPEDPLAADNRRVEVQAYVAR